MSDPMIFLTLLGLLLVLCWPWVFWVAVSLAVMAMTALVLFSNVPMG